MRSIVPQAIAPDNEEAYRQAVATARLAFPAWHAWLPRHYETHETMRHRGIMRRMADALLTVAEAGHALGVSRSTVWRMIQRGELPSVRRGGLRLVPATAVRRRPPRRERAAVPPFSEDHPIFRLVGAGRGGGGAPGARDKHALLDDE